MAEQEVPPTPTPPTPTPIQIAWINFVKSVRVLLVPQTDDRPLDQYLQFRDAVVELVQSQRFLDQLNKAYPPQDSESGNDQFEDIGKCCPAGTSSINACD